MGFTMMFVLVHYSQITVAQTAFLDIEVLIQGRTIFLGILTGLAIPFASNIIPIQQALSNTLRSGLDKMRSSIDDVEVEMVRYEAQGLSVN